MSTKQTTAVAQNAAPTQAAADQPTIYAVCDLGIAQSGEEKTDTSG